MIQKWYEVTCDYSECGCVIRHYMGDTIKDVVEQVKNDGAIVKYCKGRRQPYIFCNEECYNNWVRENE